MYGVDMQYVSKSTLLLVKKKEKDSAHLVTVTDSAAQIYMFNYIIALTLLAYAK
jgi:hypothetical protein